MVSGYQSRQTKEWGLNILNGVHNHGMEPGLEGHILTGRLKEDDKKIVRDLTKSKMLPRNILINLKNKRPHCMTNVKQVYNKRQQIWKANRGDKKLLQYLISKLEEHNYAYFSKTQSESTTIEDIFWAHPSFVKLFNKFSTVLVMDSTYKTNMYKMPMFEVVGITSTTSRIPFSWEAVDSQNLDSQPSPSPTTSLYKRKKCARLPKAIPVIRPIGYMSRFMLPFIEKMVDVLGDGHCGFRAIVEFMGLAEQNHIMIRTHLIQELKDHTDDYIEVFAGEDRYNNILIDLHPPANMKGCAHLIDKWLTFLNMDQTIIFF
ncbi:hypothetical protein MTR_1g052890 [Medicago truncatula]|uniref:OTU domain-containing protein n=1 Tax=Medicago truncatula TaxID=3880 RepID=A0A072VJK8_MEDTR|nr:hypothetical protein MTR_1g052890 [Medicago truncatula]